MDCIKKPFKIAFIGGALDSAIGYTHYIASQMDHRFILCAGSFSRDDNRNRKTAFTWGIDKKHLYSEWKELLKNEIDNIDVVVILTPTPDHYEMIMMALDLGYAVISEKALTTSYKRGMDIVNKIDEKRAFFAVTHNYTGYPMIRELQKMIQDGKLGKITHINIEMPQESFARLLYGQRPKPQEWRLKDGEIPGISLDLAAHLQHIIYFLTSKNPVELVADQSSFGWFEDVVDNVFTILRYKDNMKVNMWYGKASIGDRNGLRIRVYGDRGSAEWYQLNPEELFYNTIEGDRMIIDRASNVTISNQLRYNRFKSGHPAGFIEAFGNLYVDIADKLEQYKIDGNHNIDWSYDAKQAIKGLEVFEAIQQSSKENIWIDIGD